MLTRLSVHSGERLLNTTICLQKLIRCKFSCLGYNSVNTPLKKQLLFNVHNHSKVCGFYLVRNESTVNTIGNEAILKTEPELLAQQAQNVVPQTSTILEKDLISEIPEPPVPSLTENIVDTIQYVNGEPTFASIGLGGYGPIGLVQYYFEWLHNSLHMPWWAAIIVTSCVIKIATTPIAISTQKNSSKMQHVLPEMVAIQERMSEARKSGSSEEAAVCAAELGEFFKKNKVKIFPMSNMLRFGIHVPVFIALREMANAPVESLKHGGLYWFKDLTIADPYYILPLCTTATMYIVTENAMRGANTANVTPLMRYVMRAVPLLSFLFSMHFPGAVLCHWVVANILTTAKSQIFKCKKVQIYLNIPQPIKHPASALPAKTSQNFKEAFTNSWKNMKLTNKLTNHQRADKLLFNEAGKAPLKKTYKYNPVQNPQKAFSAAKK